MNRENLIHKTTERIRKEMAIEIDKLKLLEPTETLEITVRLVHDPAKTFRRSGKNFYLKRELTNAELQEISNLPWTDQLKRVVDLIINMNNNRPTRKADIESAAGREYFTNYELGPTFEKANCPFRLVQIPESKGDYGEYRFFRKV